MEKRKKKKKVVHYFFYLKASCFFKYTWKDNMQVKSKQKETMREGGGGGSVQSAVGSFRSPILLTGLLLSFIYTHILQISGETALMKHWSGVYFPLELGAGGSGLLVSTKKNKKKKPKTKGKMNYKHTVDDVLEDLRYKNQSILFTRLLPSSHKHFSTVGLWRCIAHSCIVLTARLENS